MEIYEYSMSEVEYINLGEYGYAIIRKYEFGDKSPTEYDASVWQQADGEWHATDRFKTIGQVKQAISNIVFG